MHFNTRYLSPHFGRIYTPGGDRNSIPLEALENLYPGLHQIVKSPTRKNKILDFICTDLYSFYQVPEVVNPLEADDNKKAKPSDHSIMNLMSIVGLS